MDSPLVNIEIRHLKQVLFKDQRASFSVFDGDRKVLTIRDIKEIVRKGRDYVSDRQALLIFNTERFRHLR